MPSMPSTETYMHVYHSLSRLTAAVSCDLQLHVSCHEQAIEIDLTNQRYEKQRQNQLRKLLAACCIYAIYCGTTTQVFSGTFLAPDTSQDNLFSRIHLADVALLLCILYILQSTINLVKKEKLLFCLDFGLQLQTEFWLSRSNLFIPASHIHDVVINEVIENLDIHYILIARTKGSLFKRKPIIAIFNSLRPSVDCLETIYKYIYNVMQDSVKATSSPL